MTKNIGSTDKVLRIELAIAITIAAVYFKSWWGLLALVPLLTGLFSVCPLYLILGVNTCNANHAK